MVYRTSDQIAKTAMNHEAGVRLAKEARDRGEYALAWKHAQAYRLDALDLLDLGLPERYRPKGFNPGVPKAMGCV
ncbi:hypothetical protein EXS62_01965 [Candidatus Kaiserbacteria bacterium]|nr:hypothetical protein [Candidatus Kaiserbacteria bacterium]